MSRDLGVLLIAFGWAAGVGVAGLLAVRFWPRRSLRGALLAVPLVTVASVVAGVVEPARVMFLSSHDLSVALTVSAVAAVVALAVSWMLGQVVVRDVDIVRGRARGLADPDLTDQSPRTDQPPLPDQPPLAHQPALPDQSALTHQPAQSAQPAQPDVTDLPDQAGRPQGRPALRELAELDGDLVQARQVLVEARRRERAMEESRRELVAWVSHDLRTPLAGMRAMAEALEDGVAPDPARYHRQIRREVDRLSRLVDDLFELSRIRAGGLSLTLEHVDLRDLVTDVVSGSSALAASRGVAVDATADAASLVADGNGLGRVLANLVVNAIRHTPSDGTVHVRAERDGGDVVLSVSDACGGIAEADLSRVFEPGWRGTPSRTPGVDGGAGLGLAIARGIIEAHRGQISVANVGHGCRFDVRLPLVSTP